MDVSNEPYGSISRTEPSDGDMSVALLAGTSCVDFVDAAPPRSAVVRLLGSVD
jgi:hypothetical protein